MTPDAARTPVPSNRAERIRSALAAGLDALRLARREAEGARSEPVRLRWAAVGLTSALQGALMAALSGYDTAEIDAVLNPSESERIAPVALLLRRASSADCLNPPERVELSGSAQRAVEQVLRVRNAAVHALAIDSPDRLAESLVKVADLVEHLVLISPAFDVRPVRVFTALMADEIKAIRAALKETPRD